MKLTTSNLELFLLHGSLLLVQNLIYLCIMVTITNYWIIYTGSFSHKGDGVLGLNHVEVFSR